MVSKYQYFVNKNNCNTLKIYRKENKKLLCKVARKKIYNPQYYIQVCLKINWIFVIDINVDVSLNSEVATYSTEFSIWRNSL